MENNGKENTSVLIDSACGMIGRHIASGGGGDIKQSLYADQLRQKINRLKYNR